MNINLSVLSSDYYEIDPENNITSFSFFIHDEQSHYYTSIVKNLNTIELVSNDNGYYFPWLETEITIIAIVLNI